MTDTTETEADASENTNEDAAQQTQEIDWKQVARKWESRAKENTARISELETQLNETTSKTETELAARDSAVEEAKREALKFRLAAKHFLSEEDVELFLTASDEETLEKQAQRISERNSATALRPDPAQGKRTGTGTPSNADAFASAVEGIF